MLFGRWATLIGNGLNGTEGQRGIQIQRWRRRARDSVATTVAKSAGGRECLARKVVTVASSPDLNRVFGCPRIK